MGGRFRSSRRGASLLLRCFRWFLAIPVAIPPGPRSSSAASRLGSIGLGIAMNRPFGSCGRCAGRQDGASRNFVWESSCVVLSWFFRLSLRSRSRPPRPRVFVSLPSLRRRRSARSPFTTNRGHPRLAGCTRSVRLRVELPGRGRSGHARHQAAGRLPLTAGQQERSAHRSSFFSRATAAQSCPSDTVA